MSVVTGSGVELEEGACELDGACELEDGAAELDGACELGAAELGSEDGTTELTGAGSEEGSADDVFV